MAAWQQQNKMFKIIIFYLQYINNGTLGQEQQGVLDSFRKYFQSY